MNSFLIVGIGASAGGIQGLQAFFEATPPRSGIAYVVLLHLSPDHDSHLAQVLQHCTPMPVQQVTEKVRIEPDHVYVIPPDKHLEMFDGHLLVTPNLDLADRRAPVDIFFRSLAESHESHAVGVILSGTGANGSMGLKHIKEKGGAVFVQSPREAEFSEMPRNAIATNLVDEVLGVIGMPEKIITYRNSLGSVHIPEEPKERHEDDQQALRAVLTELRLRTGHDFSNYKRPTLLRRIERRVHVRNQPSLPAYAAFLVQHPDEVRALLKDLLISVTNFFRDKAPFDELENTQLPRILENKTGDDQLRIWVAGCATGEEAYTMAMICADLTIGMVDAPKIQIFATDIDDAAIAVAREGYYTINDAADVSQERLNRYFLKEGDGYRVRRELRETILFASHNFLKDSPFSRIDVVSCRNVLIYLNRSAQERVFETFHFALKPQGFLLLGASESVDGASELFRPYDREHHIWQSKPLVTRNIIVPESIPRIEIPQAPAKVLMQPRPQERFSFGDMHQQMVELYAPPSLIVNEEYDILHISEHAGRYLNFVGGEPTQNVLKVVREELRSDLRGALYQAAQHRTAVNAMNLKTRIDDNTETLNIHVRPLPEPGDNIPRGLLLVVFEQVADSAAEVAHVLTSDEPARQLEEELTRLKAKLRTSNEQHEFAAEELKAGNEELQAMNEELRSATEELETSKEELQSINEELSTVNQELKVKVEESSMTSNNLRNIINSTDIGTIILDRTFRVVLFTPAARNIFNLIPADHTRPLSDITHRLKEDNLVLNAQKVLQTLHGMECEMATVDGLIYLTRLTPYRTDEDRIQGVVISFVDITDRKKAETALRAAEQWRKLIIQSAKDYAILTLDLDRQVNSWNGGAQNTFGYQDDEIIGQIGDILFTPEDRANGDAEKEAQRALTDGRAENERWHLRKDGSRFWGSGITHPLKDDHDKPIGFVKIMRDLTERQRVEEALHISEERYRIALGSAEMAAWDWTSATQKSIWNDQHFYILGLLPDGQEKSVAFFLSHVHPDDVAAVEFAFYKATKEDSLYRAEFRIVRADNGDIRWMSGFGRAVTRDERGRAKRIVGVMYDITARKRVEEQKDEFIGIASHELRTPVTSIKAYAEIIQEIFEEKGDVQNALLMRKLDEQVDRLTNLIYALLDTTRITAGKLQFDKTDFNIDDLVTDTAETMQRIAGTQRVELELKADTVIHADNERVRQVLINLIGNAIKYSPGRDRVVVTSSSDGNMITIGVQDFGIGIEEESTLLVFDRFFQGGGETAFSGLGLGLFISASIVRQHGGMISVTSKKGEGATFNFTLPIRAGE